jgi:hypothetical protein
VTGTHWPNCQAGYRGTFWASSRQQSFSLGPCFITLSVPFSKAKVSGSAECFILRIPPTNSQSHCLTNPDVPEKALAAYLISAKL